MTSIMNTTAGEPMVDARVAASTLRLPYYWFSDNTMRAKHRIPHYLLGGLVRYRLSELCAWAASTSASRQRGTQNREDEA